MDKLTVVRALSVKQPYAEQILRGTKKVEYRTRPTTTRERVYVYASKKPGNVRDFERLKIQVGDLPVGVLVGTIEIVGCRGADRNYQWLLANPKRLAKPIKPDNHPQPAWFFPFKKSGTTNRSRSRTARFAVTSKRGGR